MKLLTAKLGGGELGISAVITIAAAVTGKVPAILWIFMAAVVTDYVTGWIKAKYFIRNWNSRTGLQGIIKKFMYFLLIGISFMIGYGIKAIGQEAGIDLDFAEWIGWYVTAVMLINEFTSILENLYVIIPDKVPIWLIKTLRIADGTLEKKINGIVCKNQDCAKCELKARCNLCAEKTEEES